MIHFISIYSSLQWSGTESTVSPRYACKMRTNKSGLYFLDIRRNVRNELTIGKNTLMKSTIMKDWENKNMYVIINYQKKYTLYIYIIVCI